MVGFAIGMAELERSGFRPPLLPCSGRPLAGARSCWELLENTSYPPCLGGPAVPGTYEMQSKCLGQMDEYLGGCRGPFWLGNSQKGSQMLWFHSVQQVTRHLLSLRTHVPGWVGTRAQRRQRQGFPGCGHEGAVS